MSRGVVDATAKKMRDVGDIGYPVLRTAGNEDGFAAYRWAVGHVDRVWPVVTLKPRRLPGDTQLCPELLCLRQRPTGERCARNAGRKSQIVLDPGARSGLTPGSERVHDADVEAFGGRIHRGGKTRRARADDQQVVHAVFGGRSVHPEALGDIGIAWVLQELAASADHHRDVVAADVEAFEQCLSVGIMLDVDIYVGTRVSRQEL